MIHVPQPRVLPYGLTWDDLRPCLPQFTTSVGARAWVAHDKHGLDGGDNSCILTLGYPSHDGRERTETVFVKQTVDPAKSEAGRYRFLQRLDIPVPSLLTSVGCEAGEVIVLEFLPAIGVRAQDADELLRVLAALNTVAHPSLELFAPAVGMPMDVFDAKVAAALTWLAVDPDAGGVVDSSRWFDAYKATEQVVSHLPLALNHGELAFQQIGRTTAGRVVLFDLETTAVLPRFTDIASILSDLADLSGIDQRDLFCRYLGALASRTGATLPEEPAWTELLTVRVVSSLQALPWLIEMTGNPLVGFDPGPFARAVAADLHALGMRP